jgi:hypothetical protein
VKYIPLDAVRVSIQLRRKRDMDRTGEVKHSDLPYAADDREVFPNWKLGLLRKLQANVPFIQSAVIGTTFFLNYGIWTNMDSVWNIENNQAKYGCDQDFPNSNLHLRLPWFIT